MLLLLLLVLLLLLLLVLLLLLLLVLLLLLLLLGREGNSAAIHPHEHTTLRQQNPCTEYCSSNSTNLSS